jgi:hypothetical protein
MTKDFIEATDSNVCEWCLAEGVALYNIDGDGTMVCDDCMEDID